MNKFTWFQGIKSDEDEDGRENSVAQRWDELQVVVRCPGRDILVLEGL